MPPEGSVTTRVNRELRELRAAGLEDFLARHGHRSDASWELFSNRWADHPDRVLRLAELARAAPPPPPPADVEARLRTLSPVLRQAVRLTRAYLALREEQRYHLERILYALRERLLELGAPLADPREIRFLHVDELGDPASWPGIVARRRAEPVDTAPPDFLRGDEAIAIPAASARLDGLGISPGVVTGRVRVLHRPEEGDRLRSGEVLVTGSADPAWTPHFSRAGGLIVELGSLLSHGAVVAREYRVPAVANIRGATRRLHDGVEVTLDGRAGTVWVHGAP